MGEESALTIADYRCEFRRALPRGEAYGLYHELEVLGTARGLKRLPVLDPILFDQLQQGLVESLHAVVLVL